MAPKKGTAKTMAELDEYEIEEVPEGIPRDRWKRPLVVPVGGGKPVGYTRASTLGKVIEDTYHLNRWEVRAVALGMSRREELVARAAAIPENEGEHRDALQEIATEAKTAGGGDKGANIGTALHKLAERADAGEDLSYLPFVLADAIAAYLRWMSLFEVLASETFVVCDPLLTAGSFDRVVRLKVDLEFYHHGLRKKVILPAGTVLVLDLKTGKLESAKYWGPGYGVQQTVYACGEPYWPGKGADGRYTWEELCGAVPSDRWALILHVPGDSPADAGLVVVDLEAGRVMSDLCLDVRKARKDKALLSEAYPLEGPPREVVTATAEVVSEGLARGIENSSQAVLAAAHKVLEAIQSAANEAELERLWADHSGIWSDDHTTAAERRSTELALSGFNAKVATRLGESSVEQQVELPVQVRRTGLIASIRQAKSEAAIEKMYELNEAIWDKACSQMADARLRELEAAS